MYVALCPSEIQLECKIPSAIKASFLNINDTKNTKRKNYSNKKIIEQYLKQKQSAVPAFKNISIWLQGVAKSGQCIEQPWLGIHGSQGFRTAQQKFLNGLELRHKLEIAWQNTKELKKDTLYDNHLNATKNRQPPKEQINNSHLANVKFNYTKGTNMLCVNFYEVQKDQSNPCPSQQLYSTAS